MTHLELSDCSYPFRLAVFDQLDLYAVILESFGVFDPKDEDDRELRVSDRKGWSQ